ncbi:MAG: CGNR zinc finger domain-containing protein, partial [Pseudonocardia sp.]|nr:CGNR zinc finger domain-containing protein [Pseudonocardia sp.]
RHSRARSAPATARYGADHRGERHAGTGTRWPACSTTPRRGWWMRPARGSGSSPAAGLATGALLAGPDRAHMGVCHRCSWMFLDPSPTKRRRWCSMAVRGNRSKVGRHYRRRSGAD